MSERYTDVQCPYCGAGQDICHDDGYGYEEDQLHEQECGECGKVFVFQTSISFYYEAQKADCLNGGEHHYKPTHTIPKECTMMECVTCDTRREPTEAEWATILDTQEGARE